MRYYNPEDVADMLGIKIEKIYHYINENYLKCIKMGSNYRISQNELQKFKRKYFVQNV
ncbi:MAG: helix-turn-helix domain-containing protein [Bacillota bacterium]